MDHLHDQHFRWQVEVSKICGEGLKEAFRVIKTPKALGMSSGAPKKIPCTMLIVSTCSYLGYWNYHVNHTVLDFNLLLALDTSLKNPEPIGGLKPRSFSKR